MTRKNKHGLSHTDLTNALPDSWLPFSSTAKLPPMTGVVCQDRAMRAVDAALSIRTRGFNLYAAGEAGSGKTSTLVPLLEARAAVLPIPDDLCYVYDFRTPDRPRPIRLPTGRGRLLAREMERVTLELERMIPRILSEGTFGHIRAWIQAETRRRVEELTRRAEQHARRLGLELDGRDGDMRVVPLYHGKPIDEEAMFSLPARVRRQLEKKILAFHAHAESLSYNRRLLEREHDQRLLEAEIRAITPLVEDLIGELAGRFCETSPAVGDYLDQVREHTLENHRHFLPREDRSAEDEGETELPSGAPDPRVVYVVNVAVDRSGQDGAPMVVELLPTASNLCGYLEYRETPEAMVTDHSMIRAGALHRANGGFLVIQASDLFAQEGAWESIKRALRHKEIRVQESSVGGDLRQRRAGALKPGAVPLDVKVILIGSHDLYYTLRQEDEDFRRLFKILADFEPSMPRTRENVLALSRFAGQVCREEGFLPIHRGGMRRLVEYACRQAGHKERMTTRRADLLDVLAEADVISRGATADAIRAQDIDMAIREAALRQDSLPSSLARDISEGTVLIRTDGLAVGQINGIALYDLAGSSFGVPVRITARTYAGRRGVVNIDREVHLSGSIHDKGSLILIGYLGGCHAERQVLGLSASITFEQSYDEIDGDSASGAELYALLSSLSGMPIKQSIAVTGSVNQLGEIQPIGGVNEKIEGVFRIFRERGLTGEEGVMIPMANVQNLMLDREVIEAVKQGLFHVHAVSHVDEGIEVLTGVPAGKQRKDGSWTPGSVNEAVARRLSHLAGVTKRAFQVALDKAL
ncbi:AAA family ATPase [Myxococcota bacterium]|nr:AAA family ATPase [Myxococcota bacterium]